MQGRVPPRGPEFSVGKAFPATDEDRARVVRFLIAVRPLIVTARLLGHLPEEARSPAEKETGRFLLVQSLGVTHEAFKAFCDADRPGVFDDAVRLADAEVKEGFKRLRQRRRDQKFRERLESARNKVAYHVDLPHLLEALRRDADYTVPTWLGTGESSTADTAVPLVDLLVKDALESSMPGWEEFAQQHLATIQSDLWKLSHAAYGYWVAKALGTLRES